MFIICAKVQKRVYTRIITFLIFVFRTDFSNKTLFVPDVIMNITFLRKKKKVLFLCFETLSRNTYLMPKNT